MARQPGGGGVAWWGAGVRGCLLMESIVYEIYHWDSCCDKDGGSFTMPANGGRSASIWYLAAHLFRYVRVPPATFSVLFLVLTFSQNEASSIPL